MAYLYLKIWAALAMFLNVGYALTEGFLEEPSNITSRAGDTVTFSCLIDIDPTPYLYVYWYKSYGFSDTPSMPISSLRTINSNVDTRYSIIGSGSRYDLKISHVEVGDISFYMCKYYNGKYFDSRVAHLTVYDESLVPRCRYQPANPEVGSTISLTCSPGSPTTRTTLSLWRGENGHQLTNVRRQSDGAITYRFQLKANDNNRSYTCAFGRIFNSIHNCSVTPLNIASTISLTPNVNIGVLDQFVRFSCSASGLPKFTSYKWIVGTGSNSERITASTGRYIFSTNGNSVRLTMLRIGISDNNTEVRCIASNDLGHRKMALGKIIVQSPHIIPTEASYHDVTTYLPNILQSTKAASIAGVFPSDDLLATTDFENSIMVDISPAKKSQKEVDENEENTKIQSSAEKTPSSRTNIVLPILLTLAFLILIGIIVLVMYIKKTDRKPPEIIKRLSISKPEVLKRMSIGRPQFLEGASLRKSWQDAKQKVENLQKRASRRSREFEEEDKRQSLRDHHIEVVVNPPPPEWKIKVEDVQRQRMINYNAPTGGYSAKEQDLLNSIVSGTIKVKTLDRVEGMDIIQSADEADSQVGSEFDEDECNENQETQLDDEKIRPSAKRDETKVATIVASKTELPMPQNECGKSDEEEVIYANTNLDLSDSKEKEDNLKDDSLGINYAELDFKMSGPWDANSIIQTEPKTAYAVIDHSQKNPVVHSTCE